MTARLKTRLLQIGSVLLGGALLWLALRAVDFGELRAALAGANYWYLIPLVGMALASHMLRAWRWLLFVEALPEAQRTGMPSVRTSFFSLMIGYMVNYAAPRVGEVARAGNMAAQSEVSFSGILGTVVVERVLDVLTLLAGILVAFVITAPQMARLVPLVGSEFEGITVSTRLVTVLGILLISGLGVIYLALLWLRRREGKLHGRAIEVWSTFRHGLLSLVRLKRRAALVVSTIGIWVLYWLLAWILIPMLGIESVSLMDAFVLMIVGSAAMIVPSPGGIGSFHYVTIQTLTLLFGIALTPASAYAILGHGTQLVLYTVVGFICLLIQGRGLSLHLNHDEVAVEEEPREAPAR